MKEEEDVMEEEKKGTIDDFSSEHCIDLEYKH